MKTAHATLPSHLGQGNIVARRGKAAVTACGRYDLRP